MKKLLLSLFLILLCTFSFAQNAKQKKTSTRTLYLYSFTGVQNEKQLIRLEDEILKLKFVDKVKSKYKPENSSGQVIVTVITTSTGSEEREDFEMARLKEIIIANDLTPGKFTIREEAQ